ncbi:MAG: PilZ domain-containing protein [Candidatus Competibacteraceae bacterium]|nr:PilZ domain-containing protein [Candidatus Competibacteraceae bacterium]
MTSSPAHDLREFHRIRFPLAERPTFVCADQAFAVIDVSARGVRYLAPELPALNPGDPVAGMLRFRRGSPIKIEGNVVRVQGDHVALHLKKEIPFSLLIAEQRYLHARYPMWS